MSQSKKLIPKRRFHSFIYSDDWSLTRLENLGNFNPSSILPNQFEYVDLESVVGNQMVSHRTVDRKQAPSRAQRLAKKGDIFYQTVRPYQQNNYFFNLLEENYVFSTGYAQIRPFGDGYFLFTKLQERKFLLEVLDNCIGTSFPAINSTALAKIRVFTPLNIEEQYNIGNFFQKLDNLINTQQKKLEKAKTLKSAYLTEMFPNEGELKPKQRFIKFNDDWKVFLIKELGDIHTGNTPSTADKINWSVGEKGHVWVTPTDIKSLLISDSERYLTDIGWEKARRIPENSILITSIASIGKNSINTVPVAFNQQINAIIPYKNNAYFILSSMEKEKKRFSQLAGHTSMAIINKTEFENFTLIIPTEQEQTQIGNFFKLLDNKIALEQKKLDKLKNIKQAYLNEMFV
ncbi:hypothetical protein BGI36_09820 [Snodgrassella communis]|uniref:restriction endonuclease subunit S n=1 Tax=Snodgrassella communis TaxID=2946699 RepID=UPI000CCAEA26|nr:restriction endonuclease subunit S [Snodgrassella communis]PIT19772.1 hypothetical protein BGI36_09820 [Snodgrassella communis]